MRVPVPYEPETVSRDQLDRRAGAVVIQFGTNWCGWCRAAEPQIEKAFAGRPDLERIKIEDGPGRPLGRSFRIKLWPTLVFIRDGQEVARVTRPQSPLAITEALARL
jgi:thioredoxin 1